MERPNQELLNAYRRLQKEKKRKKSYNPSPLETLIEISLIVLVLGLFVYFMVECYTKELKTAYGVLGAMLFFAVILHLFFKSRKPVQLAIWEDSVQKTGDWTFRLDCKFVSQKMTVAFDREHHYEIEKNQKVNKSA